MAISTIIINDGESTITLGSSGPQGIPGEGVPVGGTTGQILAKASNTNYDDVWIDNYTTDVRKQVKNDSGGTLAAGTVVYVSGANGTNVLVKPALATSDSTSGTTIGILSQSLAANGIGWCIIEGTISGIDTSAATAGDPVWLSGAVAGGVLYGVANKPQAPVHLVYLGTVTRAHATQGSIEVSVNNGWELDELHNVKITTPSNGQVLVYDSAQSLWVNSSETGDISGVTATAPLTGGGTSGNVTVGIDQTALSIAESQVVNLVTDLAAKTPTSRTLTAGTGLTGGGNLTADRTFTLDNTVVSYDQSSSLRSLPLYNQKDAAEKLLAQAVWWIDAAHSSASGQTITNLGWGGSALNATAGSTGSADSNDPKFLDWTGTNYVYTTGTASNNLTVPNETALQITGDIDIRVQMAADAWSGSYQPLFNKYYDVATKRGYILDLTNTGTIRLVWSTDGTATVTAISTAAPSLSAGTAYWIRATLDVDNGAFGNDVKFYTSTDGTSWTQVGATVTQAGVTSIFANTEPVMVGTYSGGTGISAKVYRAQVLNGIGGTTVLNVDTSVITSGAATSFTALTGQTVTINRATSGRKTCVVTNPLWLFGTDDYLKVSDNDLIDFSATESVTVLAVVRQWGTPTSFGRYFTKRIAGAGWYLATNGTTAQPRFFISDGTNNASQNGTTVTAGTLNIFGGLLDRTGNLLYAINGSTLSASVSSATVGSLASADAMGVGADASPANFQDMEAYALVVFRRILTTAELALLTNYYTTRVA